MMRTVLTASLCLAACLSCRAATPATPVAPVTPVDAPGLEVRTADGAARPATEWLCHAIEPLLAPEMLASGDDMASALAWLDLAGGGFNRPGAAFAIRMAGTFVTLDLRDPAPLIARLRTLVAQPEAAAQVRVEAMRLLARLSFAQGAHGEADALLATTGRIPVWRAAGPFGTRGHADFYTSFSPERQIASFGETPRDTIGGWHPLAPSRLDGQTRPRALEPSQREGVWYLMTQVRVDGDGPCIVEIDTDASVAVWLDGKPLATVDRLQDFLPRRAHFQAAFAKGGWSRVVVKFLSTSRQAAFGMSLFDAKGHPCRFETAIGTLEAPVADDAPRGDTLDAAAWQARQEALFAVPAILADAARFPKRPEMAYLAARACLLEDLPDGALEHAGRGTGGRLTDIASALLEAEAVQAAWHLPEDLRNARALSAWNRVGDRAAPALVGRARVEIADGRHAEAVRDLNQCIAVFPKCVAAWRARAEMAQNLDWPAESRLWLDDLAAAAPDALATHLLTARYHARQRAWGKAYAAYGRALDRGSDSIRLWETALRAAQRGGDSAAAVALADALAARDPEQPEALLIAARQAALAGEHARALAIMQRVQERLPDDAASLREHGDIACRAGDVDAALLLWRTSLERDPSQYALRLLLDRAENTTYADFWTRYARDPQAALAGATGTRAGKTIRAIDQAVINFYPDGSRTDMEHGLQLILNKNGIPDASRIGIRGEVLEARTIMPGARQVQEPIRLPGQSAFTMPGLMPGAAVETRFLAHYAAPQSDAFSLPGFYFRSPDGEESFLLSEYIVRVPRGLSFGFAQRHFPGGPQIYREADGTATYIWRATDTQRVPDEEGTAPPEDFLPYVQVGLQSGWEDVNAALLNESLRVARPSGEIRRQTEALLRDYRNPNMLRDAGALHRWVMKHVEPSSIALTAQATFERRLGNRNLLLLSMLRAAGIPAQYAAARPSARFMADADWRLPSVRHFPIRLIFVPDGRTGMYLDTRLRHTAAGEILDDLSGATVYLCEPKGGRLETIPEQPPGNFCTFENATLVFGADSDTVTVNGTVQYRGLAARSRQEMMDLLTETQRITQFEDALGGRFGLAATQSFSAGSDKAYAERFRLLSRDFGMRLDDGTVECPLPVDPVRLVEDLDSPPETRQNPFRINAWHMRNDSFTFRLAPGMSCATLPEGFIANTRFGGYRLTVTRAEDDILVERQISMPPQLVAAKDFPDFVALLRQIRAAERERLRFAVETE